MNNRRNFLKHIALFGAAATVPVCDLFAKNAIPAAPDENGLFTVSHGSELLRKKSPRTISIPNVDGHKVLKGDFHIHTLFSDGLVMPKDRVHEAVDNGLDVISITDHIEYRPYLGGNGIIKLAEKNDDHNSAYNIAREEAEKNNLILVHVTEITKRMMPPGHFNALFIKDVNPIATVADNWKTMLAVAADQGAFIHWNHPGWVKPESGGLKKGEPMRFTDEHEQVRTKGHLHGVEVFNGSSYYPVALDWCHERDIVPITNSDIHQSEWNMYGHQNPLRPMSLIFAKERNYESVREAFFAGRVVGWAAGTILGRLEWVEKLFRASVAFEMNSVGLSVRNKSDIPCDLEYQGRPYELPPKGLLEIARNGSLKKLVVNNWLIGTQKRLEINLS